MPPSEIPKRTIKEWEQLLLREKDYEVIFVEGIGDKHLLLNVFKATTSTYPTVVPVEFIDIDKAEIEREGWNSRSNKHRVLYCCERIASSSLRERQLRGLVDLDWTRFIPLPKTMSSCVSSTDFNSMELYAFRTDWLAKFGALHLRLADIGNELMEAVFDATYELFRIRLANEILGWAMKEKQIEKYLSISSDKRHVVLDSDKYIKALLNDNRRGNQLKEFEQTLKSHFIKSGEDRRHWMRGHDFTFVLMWYLKKRKGTGFPYRSFDRDCCECFEGALMCSVEAAFTNEMSFLAPYRP